MAEMARIPLSEQDIRLHALSLAVQTANDPGFWLTSGVRDEQQEGGHTEVQRAGLYSDRVIYMAHAYEKWINEGIQQESQDRQTPPAASQAPDGSE